MKISRRYTSLQIYLHKIRPILQSDNSDVLKIMFEVLDIVLNQASVLV